MIGRHKVRWVRISEVKTTPEVNRPLDQGWVDRLVKNWQDSAVGVPVVSDRGAYFVILDGQHRIEAIRQMTAEDKRIECLVYEGLSLPEENYLFLLLNEDRAIHPFEKFRRMVAAELPDALAIMAVLQPLGLSIDQGAKPGAVAATVALQQIYRWDPSGVLLHNTLATLIQTFGRDSTSFQGELLKGLAIFYRQYPDASSGRLTKNLAGQAGGCSGLLGKARTIRELKGGTVANGVAEAMKDLYNKGLKKKLD